VAKIEFLEGGEGREMGHPCIGDRGVPPPAPPPSPPDRRPGTQGLEKRFTSNNSCVSLTSITFLGDAPKVADDCFEGATPTIYRKPEAKDWGETFGGRPVKLISEKP